MTRKKTLLIIIILLIIVSLAIAWQLKNKEVINPAENIGNTFEKKDLIRLDTPRPNDVIKSPLVIAGEARGNWFFEASFPVILTDANGVTIAQGIATAQGEWMTTEFVPFTATLIFKNPQYKNNGSLILKKDNPSGLPENEDNLDIPVLFDNTVNK